MKILTFSPLFPNMEKPDHSIFVETRLRHLVGTGQVQARCYADRAATRRYAEGFSWDDTSAGQVRLFSEVLARSVACSVGALSY